MEEKLMCSKCKKEYSIDHFSPDSRTLRGYAYQCKFCRNESGRKLRQTEEFKSGRNLKLAVKRRVKPEYFLYHGAKQRAKKKGLAFEIDLEDIVVPHNCPVLGIELNNESNILCDQSPTLDRIDNKFGYIKGNVKVISYRANRIKSDTNIGELEKILYYMKTESNHFRNGRSYYRKRKGYRLIEFDNKIMSLIDWSEFLGIPYGILNTRLNKYGWEVERAFTQKVQNKKKGNKHICKFSY